VDDVPNGLGLTPTQKIKKNRRETLCPVLVLAMQNREGRQDT
jgi:hypothetical protein